MMFTPCLGIIFQRVADKKVTGHKLFQSFIQENKACFWNKDLVEAINLTKFVGYIKPSTLFVTSTSERYVQVIRDAWARRILKPAKGYKIETLGDVQNIEMHKIDQIHFVPLPDIICSAVSKMNQNGRPATLDALRDEIRKECPTIKPPTARTFRQAIQMLLKQKLLEYDLEQLHVRIPPTAPYHIQQIPSKCTVECQTGQSVVNGYAPSNSLKTKKGLLARLFTKKGSPLKAMAQNIQESRNPGLQRPTHEAFKPSIESNCNSETATAAAAQKKCAATPQEYGYHRSRRRRNDLFLPNDFQIPTSYNCTVCQDYGPIDPPEWLPCFTDYTDINDEASHRKRRRRPKMEEGSGPGGGGGGGCVRTSTPVRQSSDSAFSLSPVITEISNGFCSSNRSANSSPDEPTLVKRSHTYVNMLNNESTQFEDITYGGRFLPTALSITNV